MIVTKNIYFIGMPGSGKTTIGLLVSGMLNCHFYETDWAITKAANETIGNIIKHQGEAAFRELEHNVLQGTRQLSGTIIATGGGLPCFFDNIEFMLNNGLVVWLQVPTELIIVRLARRYMQIPALANTDLKQSVPEMLSHRSHWYNRAHLSVALKNASVKENALQIVKEITAYLYSEKQQ